MPFKSKAQAGFMFVHHPEIAKEWADKTLSIKSLPEHVKKKKKAESDRMMAMKEKEMKDHKKA